MFWQDKINKGDAMENYIYALGDHCDKAIKVSEGEVIEIETRDCFNNQIDSEDYVMDSLDWDAINPATGPYYLENAKEGDVLKVDILDIQLAPLGTMACLSENGVLGKDIINTGIKKVHCDSHFAYFNDIAIPLKPMIGVIGVAPKDAPVTCGTPGSHGGNMDNTKIGIGATLYLPIFKDGAYFALGDVHAVMGDGEIMVSGVEIGAKVSVKLSVLKGISIDEPRLEDATHIYTVSSDENIETAIHKACITMNQILQKHLKYSLNDAGMLMSACGDLQFCQVVDPKRTVRFAIPKFVCDKVL